MGIHISLHRLQGNYSIEHPDWDWVRHAGDRQFPSVLHANPMVQAPDDDQLLRPKDVNQLREAINASGIDQPERFHQLADILDREPNTWIYLGY